MVKLARRRAMPHRHVPDPKEPSPFFERLRSELKFKARHRVAEAVDAVCAAFEGELTQLTKPPLPKDYSYELFYDCCSRLTRFIDSNLSTTPGFLVEMDRLIFACHSGDSGATVRKAVTMDLEIRRGQESEADEAMVEGDSGQPAASPSDIGAAKRKEVLSGGGNENGVKNNQDATDGDDEDDTSSNKSATVGDTSREWGTRKRLSTRSQSSMKQGKAKRLKRWVERGEDEREEKKKEKREGEGKSSGCVQDERKKQADAVEQDAGDKEVRNQGHEKLDERKEQADAVEQDAGDEQARNQGRGKEDVRKEEAQKRTARVISRQRTAAKATSKRGKRVHRSDAGDATGNDQNTTGGGGGGNETMASPDKHVGEATRRGEACGTVSVPRKRWNLRSAPMLTTESCGSKQKDEDGDACSQVRKGTQAPVAKEVSVSENSATPKSTQDADIGDEHSFEAESGTTPESEQEDTADNKHQILNSSVHTDLTTKPSCLDGVDGDEEDTTSNGSEAEVTQKHGNTDNVRKEGKLSIVGDFEGVPAEEDTTGNGSETEVTQKHGNTDNVRKEGKLSIVGDFEGVPAEEDTTGNGSETEVTQKHGNTDNVRKEGKLSIVGDFEGVPAEEDTIGNGSETEVTQKHDNSDNVHKLSIMDDFETVQAEEPESLGIIDVEMENASVVDLTGETQPIDEPETDQGRKSNTITDEGSTVATDARDKPTNPEDQEVVYADAIDSSDEPPVPGFCDAGMRPENEVRHFQDCLKKAIQFIDAVLCKPPRGKSCVRGCKNIRERQCIMGEPCHDDLCSNWHSAEAHRARCTNPLCEFRDRISLREIMHQIANLDEYSQAMQAQWQKKTLELIMATDDESTQLNEDMKLLLRSIDEAKEEMESLKDSKRVLQANLSAIGIMPGDDIADRFPDVESHYI